MERCSITCHVPEYDADDTYILIPPTLRLSMRKLFLSSKLSSLPHSLPKPCLRSKGITFPQKKRTRFKGT